MVTGPLQSVPNPGSPPTDARAKVRVRFRKGGDLRLVSHRDLMKCFERMLRRAALPVSATKGFHPKPRVVFPLSLALGIVGAQEVVELELDAPLAPETIHDALARHAPPGLTILSVRPIDRRLGGQPRRVCYRVPLPPALRAEVPERVRSLLARPDCWVERTRPHPRRFDLRPYLNDLRLTDDSLEIDLWVTPGGMARPEEVLGLLGLGGLLDEGAVVARVLLELHDESPNPGPMPPLPAISPLPGEDRKGGGPGRAGGAAEEGPRPTPLLPGPLSFDS